MNRNLYEVISSFQKIIVFLCLLTFQAAAIMAQPAGQNAICYIDSIVVINPACNGQCNGSIEVYAQGTGPLFYQWPALPGADSSLVNGLCAGNYVVIITDTTGCVITDSVLVEEPDPIGFGFSVINATCPGGCSGSVTVQPFDSVPYTYLWPGYMSTAPTLSNLCQGTYTVIITDPQGCTVPGSVQVGYDTPFDLNFTTTAASCLTSCDGTATVFANGIPPFSYQWGTGPIQTTQGAINLCSGMVLVSVTDSTGCVVTDTANVPLLPAPALNITVIPPVCAGVCNGQAEASVTGSGNYVFEWNTFPVQDSAVATGLCAGAYIVLVTDLLNGCGISDTAFIIDPPASVLSFSTVPSSCDNICTGTAAVISSGPGPFTYLWQSGDITQTADSLCSGTLSVTVIDSLGCAVTDSILITTQNLNFIVSEAACDSCNGIAEVNFPTGIGWQTTWFTSPVQDSAVATQLCPGNYLVLITDSVGCQIADSVTVGELQPTVVNFNITPISCPGNCDGAIALVLSGNAPFSILWPTLPGQTADSVSQLCSGIYPVVIADSAGCLLVDSILLPEPVQPQFSYITNPNSCYNVCDASAVIVPDSAGTYTYAWQTAPIQYGSSVSGICPYFTLVEITSVNGCVFMDSVLIIGTPPMDFALNIVHPSCYGDCDGFVDCLVTGGTPGYTYEWSNGFITPQAFNLCEGTYVVTVTDANGCVDSTTAVLVAPDSFSFAFVVTDASCSTCMDGSINATITGGTPGYFYYWTPGGVGGSSIDSLAPGTYNLCVADDNLCIQCTNVVVSFFNELPEIATGSNTVSVFPNPFAGHTTISVNNADQYNPRNLQLEVFDIWGRIINSFTLSSVTRADHSIDIVLNAGSSASGLYVFKLSDGRNPIITGRFMVQR